VDVLEGEFSVALIPTTLSATKLSALRIGEPVNVELDIIGKYVRRHLQAMLAGQGVTLEQLRRAGFA
jgi:riboflavin synthase